MNNEQINPLLEQEEAQLLQLWGSNGSVFAMQIQRLFASLHKARAEVEELRGKVAAMQPVVDAAIWSHSQGRITGELGSAVLAFLKATDTTE